MTTIKQRKPRTPSTEPAKGHAKWVARPVQGVGIIEITSDLGGKSTEQYAFAELRRGDDLYGYRLLKEDGTTYDLTFGEEGREGRWDCSCPDAQFNDRPNTCKHCAGTRAATAKV
jgi:hypothetical protein